ncbi:MAG: site-2 protease family protein [Tissierellia bacterium]|nr:site-2 protease family protein [Tissierellia bacterium]
MLNLNVEQIIINIIALLIAIVPHEIAHGYAAYLCGDTTAKEDGRLSLNPLHHIDPIGLLSLIILRFGWAKAVPINPYRFTRNRKLSSLFVSLAGVGTNFILGIISGILLVLFTAKSWPLISLLESVFWYNIMLGVFNLIPLPPLDGSKAVAALLPSNLEFKFYRYEKYFYFVLIFLLFSGTLPRFISPIIFKIMGIILNLGIYIWNIIL